MNNPNIIDPLPAGGITWGGKTQGPAINAGRLRPHILGPRILYVHLDELRDWVVKAGWATNEDYLRLLKDFKDAEAHIEQLMDAAADDAEKIETLEKALGWKPTGDTTNGDGEDRERELQEGRTASVTRSSAGPEDSSGKAGSGKGRKVRAARSKAS